MVSTMERGAGSVAEFAQPTFPQTDCTSGKVITILS